MTQRPLQVIDLHSILRRRIRGWKGKLIPGFLISALARVVRQKELNEMLRNAYPKEGSAFAASILETLRIRLDVRGLEMLPEGHPLAFASNHPLGGLDGIALISVLGNRYGDENVKFLVNDMLMNVEPLQKVFLPVNKYGSQGRGATLAINEAYASDCHILQFPAGLVSRLQDNGEISDLEWKKAFVAKALDFDRDIVPVRFEALNTPFFYRLARLRKRLGLKVNIEQAFLPAELCKAHDKTFRITFGKPLSAEALKKSGKSPKQLAAEIREAVYRL